MALWAFRRNTPGAGGASALGTLGLPADAQRAGFAGKRFGLPAAAAGPRPERAPGHGRRRPLRPRVRPRTARPGRHGGGHKADHQGSPYRPLDHPCSLLREARKSGGDRVGRFLREVSCASGLWLDLLRHDHSRRIRCWTQKETRNAGLPPFLVSEDCRESVVRSSLLVARLRDHLSRTRPAAPAPWAPSRRRTTPTRRSCLAPRAVPVSAAASCPRAGSVPPDSRSDGRLGARARSPGRLQSRRRGSQRCPMAQPRLAQPWHSSAEMTRERGRRGCFTCRRCCTCCARGSRCACGSRCARGPGRSRGSGSTRCRGRSGTRGRRCETAGDGNLLIGIRSRALRWSCCLRHRRCRESHNR